MRERFLCMAACILLAACSQGAASGAEHAKPGRQTDAPNLTGPGRTLTYYLDQRETVSGFQAVQLHQYNDAIKLCEGMKARITPLSATDVAKLSAGRVQIWQAPGKRAKRTDVWQFTDAFGSIQNPECRFSLKRVSKLTIRLASGKIYTIDLITGKGTVGWVTPPQYKRAPITDAQKTAQERSVIRQGTIKGPVRNVAGQPCQEWTHPEAQTAEPWTECDWSAGRRWGYPAFPGGILLASRMLNNEKTLTTTTFMVGRLPDDGQIFQTPEHVAISDKGAPVSGGNGP